MRIDRRELITGLTVTTVAATLPPLLPALAVIYGPVSGEVFFADITGNGRADLIFRDIGSRFWISLADGNGGLATPVESIHTYDGQVFFADITGNRREDLIFRGTDNHFWISLADGKGGLATPVESIHHGGPVLDGQVFFADITGNGRKDLIFRGADNHFWISLADGNGGLATPVESIHHGDPFLNTQVFFADITGNGRKDLIFRSADNHFWISLADGNGGLATPVESIHHGGPVLDGQVFFADITGNRREDLIFRGTDNHFWISLADGNGGLATPVESIHHGGQFIDSQVFFADITGNRREDLIFRSATNHFWISLADGNGGLATPVESIHHGGPVLDGQVFFADITGNGRKDLIFRGTDNHFWISLADGKGGLATPVGSVKHGT
jgi:hypothetical protein